MITFASSDQSNTKKKRDRTVCGSLILNGLCEHGKRTLKNPVSVNELNVLVMFDQISRVHKIEGHYKCVSQQLA